MPSHMFVPPESRRVVVAPHDPGNPAVPAPAVRFTPFDILISPQGDFIVDPGRNLFVSPFKSSILNVLSSETNDLLVDPAGDFVVAPFFSEDFVTSPQGDFLTDVLSNSLVTPS